MKQAELSTFTTNTLSTIAWRVRVVAKNKRTKSQKALNKNDFDHIESFMGKTEVEIQNRQQCDFIIKALSKRLESEWPSNHQKNQYLKDIETIKAIKKSFSPSKTEKSKQ